MKHGMEEERVPAEQAKKEQSVRKQENQENVLY